jgi:protein O-mannosyl-transferase
VSSKPGAVLWIAIFLGVSTLLLYAQVGRHSFLAYDDHEYVFENSRVISGLDVENVWWALRAGHAANWHPLTWLSHMLDCQLFGLNPGAHHVVNVLFHGANAVLLFLALARMTGSLWLSAVVAALFAYHPAHVESVAWISERKDVLSTFFWILTLLAYQFYTRVKSIFSYGLVSLCFTLGLMSKPMVVTLPCVLLLLDYWPLNRLHSPQDFWRLFLEKLPLFGLSAAACVVTFLVQGSSGAVVSIQDVSILSRLSNAAITYFFYLWKTVWPSPLFVPYWYDLSVGPWVMAGVFLALLLVTCVTLAFGRRAPYLRVGWFLYLGSLVPVIGLVQVGAQTAADRYTYIPSIGLFLIVAWGCADLFEKLRTPPWGIATLAASVIGVCALLTHRQAGYWKNGEMLFKHTLEADPPNLLAATLLGWTYATDLNPAIRDGVKAVELASFVSNIMQRQDAFALRVLAAGFAEQRRFPEAVQTAEEAMGLQHAKIQPQLMAQLRVECEYYKAGRTIRGK